MYNAEEILARVRRRPFRPLRLIVSEGLHYDIHHPDLVFVGRHDLHIGHPWRGHPGIYDGVTRVALVHVVALEDLPALPPFSDGQNQSTPPTGNAS
jgi:hypothetical protein